MGESVDASDAALGAHVRLVEIPATPPDAGAEGAPVRRPVRPPVPAAAPASPPLAERFGDAAGDAGFRPVPPSPPDPARSMPAAEPPALDPVETTPRASLFDARIQQVLKTEGGYTNDPADRGGETNWGITHTTARAFGYRGDMRAMTRDMAIEIYRRRYWIAPSFDLIEQIDPPIALKLLDLGITSGPATGVTFLQRALNSLNRGEQSYPDVPVDGAAGVMTRAAMKAFVAARGRDGRLVLLGMIAAQQSVFYMKIAETRPANERFEYGWQLNRALAGIAQ